MLKLLKLEFEKNKLSGYLWACLCIFITGFGFCFLFAVIPRLTPFTEGLPLPVDIQIYSDWNNFSMLVSIFFAMSFTVLSTVMHTKFTIEEYTGKRAILLFSYPESRRAILFVKCSFVFVFTTVGLLLCNTLAILLFALLSNSFGIMQAAFTLDLLPSLLSMIGVCALLAASIGMVAMWVGFWKKSMIAAVVTSVILIAPFGNIISFFPQYSVTIQFFAMAILFVVAIFLFLGLLARVNEMEAL